MKTEWIIEFNFRCQSDVRECKSQAGIWLYIFKASMGPCCLSSQSLEAWPFQQETWSWTTRGECDDHAWGQPEPTGSHPVAAEAQLAGVPSFSGWRRKATALLGTHSLLCAASCLERWATILCSSRTLFPHLENGRCLESMLTHCPCLVILYSLNKAHHLEDKGPLSFSTSRINSSSHIWWTQMGK